MSKRTELVSGQITNNDKLSIQLIEPPELPAIIRIRWPDKPSMCPPAQFDHAVAAAMRVMSNAVVELAAIRVRKKLYSAETPKARAMICGPLSFPCRRYIHGSECTFDSLPWPLGWLSVITSNRSDADRPSKGLANP
jgi:hypothetical protein